VHSNEGIHDYTHYHTEDNTTKIKHHKNSYSIQNPVNQVDLVEDGNASNFNHSIAQLNNQYMQLLNAMPPTAANQAILGNQRPMIITNQNINHIDRQTLNLTVNYKAPSNDNSMINHTKTIKVAKQRTNSANQKLSIDPESKGYQHTM
jgi:hypothetical protein